THMIADDSFDGRLVKFDLNPRHMLALCRDPAAGHRLDVGSRPDYLPSAVFRSPRWRPRQ
ncbi:hypothetical protein, partial [Mesorhizobium sp.]|uniref:hypothetical protein n=1 Tax=Mesorhizobium sp. TaxID=1871066 RepID=UPI0025D7AEB2